MRLVPEIFEAIQTGNLTGQSRAHGRVAVLPYWQLNSTNPSYGNSIRGPYRYWTDGSTDLEYEVPSVQSIEWNRSLDQDIATCTVKIFNSWHNLNSEAPELAGQLGKPGFFWPLRGQSDDSVATWNHSTSRGAYTRDGTWDPSFSWNNVLIEDVLIKTFEGYGGRPTTGNYTSIDDNISDGNLVQTGVWIVDTVTGGSDGMLTLTCRDIGRILLDQMVFPPLVPGGVYPLEYYLEGKSPFDSFWGPKVKSGILPASQGEVKADAYDSSADALSDTSVTSSYPVSASVDGNETTYALSNAWAEPDDSDYVWFEYEIGQDINEISFTPWAGGYECYVCVRESGTWQGSAPVVSGGGVNYIKKLNIPMYAPDGSEQPIRIQLKDVDDQTSAAAHYTAQRVRLGFKHLYYSGVPDASGNQYRAGIREFYAYRSGDNVSPYTSDFSALPWTFAMDQHPTRGYWVMDDSGNVYGFGDAADYDSNAFGQVPIVGIGVALSAHPDGKGYWALDWRGNVYAYGSATYYGEYLYPDPSVGLNEMPKAQALDIVSTYTGNGYWVVYSDGYVRGFGDAANYTTSSYTQIPTTKVATFMDVFLRNNYQVGRYLPYLRRLKSVAIESHPKKIGFWVTDGSGQVWSYGGCTHRGQLYERVYNKGMSSSFRLEPLDWASAIESTVSGNGYWILFASGKIAAFGDARNQGPVDIYEHLRGFEQNIAVDPQYFDYSGFRYLTWGFARDPDGSGFWVLTAAGEVLHYDAEFWGQPGYQGATGYRWHEGNWDGDYCVDSATEILTKEGWKDYSTLKSGDIVYSVNPVSQRGEWKRVESVYIGEAKERKMVSLSHQNHNSLTTPHHKWLVKKSYSGEYMFSETQDLKHGDSILRTAKLDNHTQTYSDNLVELMAWFVAEGEVRQDSGAIRISQSKTKNTEFHQRIFKLLTEMYGDPDIGSSRGYTRNPNMIKAVESVKNGTFTKSEASKNFGVSIGGIAWHINNNSDKDLRVQKNWHVENIKESGVQTFSICQEKAKELLGLCDIDHDFKIPTWEFIANLTGDQAYMFIEIFCNGDGDDVADLYQGFHQKRPETVNRLQAIASIAGIGSCSSLNSAGMTRLGLHKTEHFVVSALNEEQVTYNDIVWCPLVEDNHTWLARRDGKVFVTGNSSIAKELLMWAGFLNYDSDIGPTESPTVLGGVESTGIKSDVEITGDKFDKQTIIDVIRELIEVVGYCVDDQTEILTDSGWKSHNELSIGDSVLSLNSETGLSEWKPVTDIYREHKSGLMYAMENRSHSSLTTSNHRWLVKTSPSSNKIREKTTETLTDADGIIRSAEINNEHQTYPDWLVELAAWYWTEGNFKSSNTGTIEITQSKDANPEKWQRIYNLLLEQFGQPGPLPRGEFANFIPYEIKLKAMNLFESGMTCTEVANELDLKKATVHSWIKNGINNTDHLWRSYDHKFMIHSSATKELLSIVDGKDKIPTWEFIRNLTAEQARLFVDISVMGDGWIRNDRAMSFTQKNNIDRFSMACAIAGYPFSWSEPDKETECEVISVSKVPRLAYPLASAKINDKLIVGPEYYSGVIWCPEVQDNHSWFARRNGKTYYTGNTFYIDVEGGARIQSPNWWSAGNFDLNGQRIYVVEDTFTEGDENDELFIPLVHESVDMLSYSATLSSADKRSELIIGTETPDPKNPTATKFIRYTPPSALDQVKPGVPSMRNIVRQGIWTSQIFELQEERRLMAELIGLHAWFAQRTGSVSIVGNPCLSVDDQVRLIERNTSETYCVDDDTEILTRRGWLQRDELQIGDIAYSLNPDTLQAEWVPVVGMYQEYRQDESMRLLEHKRHSSLTTLDHRWYIRREGSQRWEWKTTEELGRSDQLLKAAAVDHPDDPIYSDEFVELIGWYMAEGCERIPGKRERESMGWLDETRQPRQLTISQHLTANPEKCQSIIRCLEVEATSWDHNRGRNFRVDVELARRIEAVAPDRAATKEFILSLTKSQLDLFIRACIMGDGHFQDSCTRFTQDEGPILESFLFACSIAGIPYTVNDGSGSDIHKTVNLSVKDFTYPALRGDKKKNEIVKYDGYVWCPTLATNHIWYARRNGTVYFTGNCHRIQSISSRLDNQSGVYTMDLNTHWMGTADNWVITTETGHGDAYSNSPYVSISERVDSWQSYTNRGLTVGGYGSIDDPFEASGEFDSAVTTVASNPVWGVDSEAYLATGFGDDNQFVNFMLYGNGVDWFEDDSSSTLINTYLNIFESGKEPILTFGLAPAAYQDSGDAGPDTSDPSAFIDKLIEVLDEYSISRVIVWKDFEEIGYDIDRYVDFFDLVYTAVKDLNEGIQVYGPNVNLAARSAGYDTSYNGVTVDSRDIGLLTDFIANAAAYDGIAISGSFSDSDWADLIDYLKDTEGIDDEFLVSLRAATTGAPTELNESLDETDIALWPSGTVFEKPYDDDFGSWTMSGELNLRTRVEDIYISPESMSAPLGDSFLFQIYSGASLIFSRTIYAYEDEVLIGDLGSVGSVTEFTFTASGVPARAGTGELKLKFSADSVGSEVVRDQIVIIEA